MSKYLSNIYSKVIAKSDSAASHYH